MIQDLRQNQISKLYILMMGIALSGCSWLFPTNNDDYPYPLEEHSGMDYDVCLTLNGEESLRSFIKENSKLESLKKKPPMNLHALRYRVKQDAQNIRYALKQKGYFDAKVKATLNDKSDPKIVGVSVETGTPYTIGGFSLEILDHDRSMKLSPSQLQRLIRIEVGDLVDESKIFEANSRLERFFKNQGYPFVTMEIPEGRVNKETKHLSTTFRATLRGLRKYGHLRIQGMKTVPENYVRHRIVWHSGQIYDDRQVERTKRKLINSALFSSVSIMTKHVDDKEEVPLTLELLEAPPRLIGIGIDYTTSQGVGSRFTWEHQNFLGGAEALKLEAKGSQKQALSRLSFEVPDTFMTDLNFLTWLEARYDNTRAYRGHVYDLYSGFHYQSFESVHVFLGVEYERSKLTRLTTQRKNYLSIPFSVGIDRRNDVLNPHQGGKIATDITPYFGSLGQSNKMLKVLLNANYYLSVIPKNTFVIGFWGRVGHISLIKNGDIPLDKRFYSGGLNSVRGYGYQKIGPIDSLGNPTGGRRLIELGIEPRLKITDTIGCVAFAEVGFLGQDDLFSQQESRYLIGYGAGLRYYTAIGPLRFDIAFPTKKRSLRGDRYDSPFQLYMSIGQAF